MVAMDNGHTFDFIEGEMLEKSPFTFKDFFKQRKRWMQGEFCDFCIVSFVRNTHNLF